MDELDNFEESLIQSIMDADHKDLIDEIVAAGDDPRILVAEIDAALMNARMITSKSKLDNARSQLAAFRSKGQNISPREREMARERFDKIRDGDPQLRSKSMMAARKGIRSSDQDEDDVVDDLAEALRLEDEEGDR